MSNNNYLWDKTGEPDPDIQELEQVLSTLRYQPRPLEIPERVHLGQRRYLYPALAVAATLALLLLSVGLWLSFNRRQETRESAAAKSPIESKGTGDKPTLQVTKDAVAIEDPRPTSDQPERRIQEKSGVLARADRRRNFVRRQRDLTSVERAEAKNAKEQLLLALRLASAKLNLAQKRTQAMPPASLIRNQHKVG